jgi:hypothetical protein
MDGVPADNDVSKDEIAEAGRADLVWRSKAAQRGDENLDTVAEKSIRGTGFHSGLFRTSEKIARRTRSLTSGRCDWLEPPGSGDR